MRYLLIAVNQLFFWWIFLSNSIDDAIDKNLLRMQSDFLAIHSIILALK
jgi:hypothetical protein